MSTTPTRRHATADGLWLLLFVFAGWLLFVRWLGGGGGGLEWTGKRLEGPTGFKEITINLDAVLFMLILVELDRLPNGKRHFICVIIFACVRSYWLSARFAFECVCICGRFVHWTDIQKSHTLSFAIFPWSWIYLQNGKRNLVCVIIICACVRSYWLSTRFAPECVCVFMACLCIGPTLTCWQFVIQKSHTLSCVLQRYIFP